MKKHCFLLLNLLMVSLLSVKTISNPNQSLDMEKDFIVFPPMSFKLNVLSNEIMKASV